MSLARLRRFMVESGFTYSVVPGFHRYDRVHEDGRSQVVLVFRWSNHRVAQERETSPSYLVFVDDVEEGNTGLTGRLILPLWEKGAEQKRPWDQVATELRNVFAPMWDLPHEYAVEYGREMYDFPRYFV